MWFGKLYKENAVFETEERLLSEQEKNDPWRGTEGTVHALLKEDLTLVASRFSHHKREVSAVYNTREQWAELRDGAGNVLAIFTARGGPTNLHNVFVTPILLSENEMFQISEAFRSVQVVFLR